MRIRLSPTCYPDARAPPLSLRLDLSAVALSWTHTQHDTRVPHALHVRAAAPTEGLLSLSRRMLASPDRVHELDYASPVF